MFGENRQLILHNVPDDVYVDAKILMDQDVPQSGNFLPLDFRMVAFGLGRQLLRCLTDDFKVPDHRVACAPVICQLDLAHPRDELTNRTGSFNDVFEVCPIVPRHGPLQIESFRAVAAARHP